jgi:hypothetical protein
MKLNFEIPPEKLAKNPALAQAYQEEIAYQTQKANGELDKKKKIEITENLAKEMREVRLILNEPDYFTCPTLYRAYLGKHYDTWPIKYLPFNTLVRLGREYAEIQWSEAEINEHGIVEAKRLTMAHARRLAKITAIAYWGERPFGNIARAFFTRYFFRRMSPAMFLNVVRILNIQGGYQDFSLSIELIHGKRLTEPAPIETDKKG